MQNLYYVNIIPPPVQTDCWRRDPFEEYFITTVCNNLPFDVLKNYVNGLNFFYQGWYFQARDMFASLEDLFGKEEERPRLFVSKALLELAKANTQLGKFKEAEQELHESLSALKDSSERNETAEVGIKAKIDLNLGIVYNEQKYFDKAMKHLNDALDALRGFEAQNFLDMAKIYRNTAIICVELKQYQQAFQYFQKSKDILDTNLPKNGLIHPEVGRTAYHYGILQQVLRHDKEAFAEFEKCLKIFTMTLPENHPDIVSVYHEFAVIYARLNLFVEAEKYFDFVLNMRRIGLGEPHPAVAQTYLEKGSCLGEQGRDNEAIRDFNKALEIAQTAYEPSCPALGAYYLKVGRFYIKMKLYGEAVELTQKTLNMYRKAYGIDHICMIQVYHTLGTLYKTLKRYKESIVNYQKDLEISKKNYGENHPDVANSYYWLATVLAESGQREKALDYMAKCLEIDLKYCGEDSLRVAVGYFEISKILIQSKKLEEAKKFFELTIKMEQKHYGEVHPLLANRYFLLGIELRDHFYHTEALKYLKKALEIDKMIFGMKHPRIAKILQAIGNLYNNKEDYDEALEYFNEALEVNKQLFTEMSMEVHEILRNVGNVYYNMDEPEKALEAYEKAQKIAIKCKGPKDFSVGVLFLDIGSTVIFSGGKECKALKLLQEGEKILENYFGKFELQYLETFYSRARVMKNLKNYALSTFELKKAFMICKKHHKSKAKKLKCLADSVERQQAKYDCTYEEFDKFL